MIGLIDYMRGRQRPAPGTGEQVLSLALAHVPDAFAAPDLLQVRQLTGCREAADAVLIRRLAGAGDPHRRDRAAARDPRLPAPEGEGGPLGSRGSDRAAFAALARREAAAALPRPSPSAYRPLRTSSGRLADVYEALALRFGFAASVGGRHDWTNVALSEDNAWIAATQREAVSVWAASKPSVPVASVGTNVLATGAPLLHFSSDAQYVMWTEAGAAHRLSLRDEDRGTDAHRVWAVNQQAPIEAMAWRSDLMALRACGGGELSQWPAGAARAAPPPLPQHAASRHDLAAVASGLRERAAWLGVETLAWTGRAQDLCIVAACADLAGNRLFDVRAGQFGARLSCAALDAPLVPHWSLWLEVTRAAEVRWLPLPRHLAVIGASESVVLAFADAGGRPARGWMVNGKWLDASDDGRVLTVRDSVWTLGACVSPYDLSGEPPYVLVYQIHQLAAGRSIALDWSPPAGAGPRLGRLAADGTRAILAHGRHACVINLCCAAAPAAMWWDHAARWLGSCFGRYPLPYTTRPLAAEELARVDE